MFVIIAGLTLTVWAMLVICYAAWVNKTETPEYKLIRDYVRTINRENEQ